MKKFLAIAVAAATLFMAVNAFAVNRNNVGCGWGSMAFESKSGLFWELLATSINGTLSNQVFGISSGTAGCESPSADSASNSRLENFVADNMDLLARDVAQGNGEYLNTLANLMEVEQTERGQFNRTLQSNFSSIFTSNSVSHTEVISNIRTVVDAG